ncbi:carboxylate--amine ligase [Peptoniphilus equinus]|uniref:Carboxylate--amine ligase n=1 Tax=Peptoniphilus equinus TaxID=3016343 RepID=A0ABY7QUJ2_9FIRM|nr:carboxylate--amine ligase [Peptoniphilus equinus]WBW50026.1 carboxylate--amine ligase [Peptoniphilus equinus]
MNKAVVLGTNYYIGLSTVRNLGRNGVHVVSVDYAPSHYGVSKYVSERLIAPHYEKEEAQLVDFLIDYAKKQKEKPVLIPTADLYVSFMEKNFDVLKAYYLWPNDKKGLYAELSDKETLLKYTEPLGIPTPEIIPMDTDNLEEVVSENLGFPCVIKPRDSMPFVNRFREKMFMVHSRSELTTKMALCRQEGFDVFVQRIVMGPESNCYSFDVYMQDGEAKSYLTTSKIRQWPNNFGASTYAKQEYIPELYDLCMPLFKTVDYQGFAEVELKRDQRNNTIYLVEVNVRFVNFVEMHCHLGMNTPMMYYNHAIGKPVSGVKLKHNTETYWKYLYEDIPSIKNYLKTGQMTLPDILKTFRLKKVASTFAWDDLGPGWTFFTWAVTNKFKRLFKQ